MRLVFLGLSVTSSWGNGHATTYRGLLRALVERGHDVLFLERDMPWYAANRDHATSDCGRVELYGSVDELKLRFTRDVQSADAVVVGSYVPDGIPVGEWVTRTARGVPCFYDIDTPVTLAALERGDCEYLSPELVPRYRLYLSFTGGPTLGRLEHELGSPMARALYCSADPDVYRPEAVERAWLLGYLGTYSVDRQPMLEKLLVAVARRLEHERFVVAGPQYPTSLAWPANVERIDHLAPADHRGFYNRQAFTLNVTRADMVRAGHSPSVRLFEAAACGVPIVSDPWAGLGELFEPGRELFVARSTDDVLDFVQHTTDSERRAMGERARARVLAAHTARHRAAELERHLEDAVRRRKANAGVVPRSSVSARGARASRSGEDG